MNQKSHVSEFDSLSYWIGRHEQYQADPKGVGNAAMDSAENEKIYRAIDTYVGQIVQHLKLPGSPQVLDLGCGIGMLAAAFLRNGCLYTGIDISNKAVEIARQRHPAARFHVGNIANLPLQDRFDLIIERTVFIHLVEDEYWQSVIREVKRLLKPQGVFVMIDHLPLQAADAPGSGAHVRFRLMADYLRAFEQSGLRFDLEQRQALASVMQLSPHTHLASHA